MSKVVLGMIVSLDGYVNDRNGDLSHYPDFEALSKTDLFQEAIRTTGAVVMGRHAYEMANGNFTGYEFQVPIFVVTHQPPATVAKGENENLKFTFVTNGIESAIQQAKAAAGEKNVTIVGGADIGRQSLQAGLVDELEIDFSPILLGGGLRLFESFDAPIKLETTTVLQYAGVIHQVFRVLK